MSDGCCSVKAAAKRGDVERSLDAAFTRSLCRYGFTFVNAFFSSAMAIPALSHWQWWLRPRW
ncbi:hypothetical protein [Novipirellula galeiformis]|uniref:hypothetical protein n=1 Tax=Novipirellula galeiformis TaxID=2528004 RepID=UPI0011B359BB|nr:hypothetical protein [Novipirellula galeiformis]